MTWPISPWSTWKGKISRPTRNRNSCLHAGDPVDVARVAEALDYAHAKGVVHRDIKPANIMRLKETKDVKVTDFGIARIASSSKTKTGGRARDAFLHVSGQVAGKKVDGRSDIFSLGVVLFELLAGQKAFHRRGHNFAHVSDCTGETPFG